MEADVPAENRSRGTIRSRLRASLRAASSVGQVALDAVNRARNAQPVDPPPIDGGWVVLDEEDGGTSDSDETTKADEGFHNGGLFDSEPLSVGYVVPGGSSEDDSQEDGSQEDGSQEDGSQEDAESGDRTAGEDDCGFS